MCWKMARENRPRSGRWEGAAPKSNVIGRVTVATKFPAIFRPRPSEDNLFERLRDMHM